MPSNLEPSPIHPHPHDKAACDRRLADLKRLQLTFLDKIRIYLTLKDPVMIEKLKSRKLWVTIAAAALTALATSLGLDPYLAAKIIAGLVGTYVVAQGAVDTAAALKK